MAGANHSFETARTLPPSWEEIRSNTKVRMFAYQRRRQR